MPQAIDMFMSSCTLFVFFSLIEYAIVNVMMGDISDIERKDKDPSSVSHIRNIIKIGHSKLARKTTICVNKVRPELIWLWDDNYPPGMPGVQIFLFDAATQDELTPRETNYSISLMLIVLLIFSACVQSSHEWESGRDNDKHDHIIRNTEASLNCCRRMPRPYQWNNLQTLAPEWEATLTPTTTTTSSPPPQATELPQVLRRFVNNNEH